MIVLFKIWKFLSFRLLIFIIIIITLSSNNFNMNFKFCEYDSMKHETTSQYIQILI